MKRARTRITYSPGSGTRDDFIEKDAVIPDDIAELLDPSVMYDDGDEDAPVLASGGDGSSAGYEEASKTVPKLLAWVGDDRGRAAHALDLEGKRDKPRSGAIDALETLMKED